MLLRPFLFLIFTLFLTSRCTGQKGNTKRSLGLSAKIDKVSLTQKGYIQFLRYLVDVPVISDFTFCIWLKSSNLTYAHPLLSYSEHESERYIRAWVSPHGEEINLSVREIPIISVPVGIKEHEWYHICQSWSSKTGHWDLFLNGRLKAHGFNDKARGIMLPKGGDIVVGQEYTDFDKGLDDGIEGDIFGFNMVLAAASMTHKQIQNKPYSYSNRRIYNTEKKRGDFMVQSLPLVFRRKPKILVDPTKTVTPVTVQEITSENVNHKLEELADESVNVERSIKLNVKENKSDLNNDDEDNFRRNKRQNFNYFPVSFMRFPIFDHDSKPTATLRPFDRTYYRMKTFPQYAMRHQYQSESIIPPYRKVNNRISNDILNYNNKPLGLQLIELSYNNCILGRGAPLKNSLISWTKTPVRVFGGAILKTVEPFCLR